MRVVYGVVIDYGGFKKNLLIILCNGEDIEEYIGKSFPGWRIIGVEVIG